MIAPESIAFCVSLMLASGAMILGVVLHRRMRKQADLAPWRELSRQLTQAQQDVGELMRQLDRSGERLEAKVDAKLQQLRQALAEVQQKADELRNLAAGNSPAGGKRPIRVGASQGVEALALSREGLDAVEIARRMHLDVGEVELLLSLRRSHPAASAEVDET